MSCLQARFAGLVSYGLSATMLGEILPLGRALHASTMRRQVHATAQRLQGAQTSRRDGSEDIRDLPLYLNPQAEHLPGWLPVTMPITVMTTRTRN